MSELRSNDQLLAELEKIQRRGWNYETRRIAGQAKEEILRLRDGYKRPSVGTGSMNAQEHGTSSLDWIRGWNACLDALDKAEEARSALKEVSP